MPGLLPAHKPSYLETFLHRLENEWTYEAQSACYKECDNLEECDCYRSFIHTEEVIQWMRRSDTDESVESNDALPNADRIIEELHDKIRMHRAFTFPINSRPILYGDDACVLVFSILLQQGCGEYIDIFQSAKMYDRFLESTSIQDCDSLRGKFHDQGIRDTNMVNDVIRGFEERKWAYIPPRLKLHMEGNFEGGNYVMPFCKRNPVNEKGGTASVFEIKVQEKFITDPELRRVLEPSSHKDPKFGPCYRMALKTFSKSMHAVYDWEKAAFSGLENSDKSPIVRYLGCFSHDEEIAGSKRTTYNLLLEFGEMDLEEYCADLTNVPPVRTQEILRFWRSLFKVADAINQVHNVCIGRGKHTKNYDGWHADIKPDNILSVHGEFKLADFGFARFSERESDNGSAPMHHIEGGTDTYGAPEVARMKTSGTMTPVLQTIDTWSFGCVLSVAATWIVLGFQGIRQYRVLRWRAPGNVTPDGKPSDRFHDGNYVLPQIKAWHNFLRAHVRITHTVTPKVLDLIEANMLLSNPAQRLTSQGLCKALKELLVSAEALFMNSQREFSPMDESVGHALFIIDQSAEAPDCKSPELYGYSARGPLQVNVTLENTAPSTLHIPFDASDSKSNRPGKNSRLERVPLAKTPHRTEILKEEMKMNRSHLVLEVTQEPGNDLDFKKYHGAYCLSPNNSESELQFPGSSTNSENRRPPSRNPNRRQRSPVRAPSPEKISSVFVNRHNGVPIPSPPSRVRDPSQPWPILTPPEMIYGRTRGLIDPHFRVTDDGVGETASNFQALPPVSGDRTMDKQPPTSSRSLPSDIGAKATPAVKELSPLSPSNHSQLNEEKREVEPFKSELIDSEGGVRLPRHNEEKHPVSITSDLPERSDPLNTIVVPLPSHVYDLEFDVCKVRKQLESLQPHGNWQKFKSMFAKEETDSYLGKYIFDRDIVFVIDDGTTMAQHWPQVTFVAQTLAMKVSGLDDDGIDVRFCINGGKYNKNRLLGHAGLDYLKSTLDSIRPTVPEDPADYHETDMNHTLEDIFNDYNGKSEYKATTVIVLTDGVWKGTTPPDMIDKNIVKFARGIEGKREFSSRHFTIGFIQFGDGEPERRKLAALDDDLCRTNNLNDIIDACTWRDKVTKMLLGSFVAAKDSVTAPTGPKTHYDSDIGDLFAKFNSGQLPLVVALAEGSSSSRGPSTELDGGLFGRSGTDLTDLSSPTNRGKKNRPRIRDSIFSPFKTSKKKNTTSPAHS